MNIEPPTPVNGNACNSHGFPSKQEQFRHCPLRNIQHDKHTHTTDIWNMISLQTNPNSLIFDHILLHKYNQTTFTSKDRYNL